MDFITKKAFYRGIDDDVPDEAEWRGLASICILSTMVMVMVSTTVCMFVGFDDEINISLSI